MGDNIKSSRYKTKKDRRGKKTQFQTQSSFREVMFSATVGSQQDDSAQDINLDNPANQPEDSVSALEWLPIQDQRLFSAASWDTKMRIYSVNASGYQKSLSLATTLSTESVVFCTAWKSDCSLCFAGCADGAIRAFSIQGGQSQIVGKHDGPVRSLYYLEQANLLLSCSYDKSIRVWQIGQQQPALALPLNHKVYASDLQGSLLLLGLSEEKYSVIDLSNLQNLGKGNIDYKESPLGVGSQITAIGCFLKGNGFAIASFDGRAHLGTLNKDYKGLFSSSSIITFKCHKNDSKKLLYPVHGIGFHPANDNFVYTGAGDGIISFWDTERKNKIKSFNFTAPVNRMRMSSDGLLFAYATGYDWAKGIEDAAKYKPKICVHIMNETELKYTGNQTIVVSPYACADIS
eukprot:TRINITY_DN1006_c0_g1_i1.p1 TRINITY_DN1006_c0_g1~~TRINITY_DN1006_c0_g1_i1.p1  ORF type:complete len:403 (+),score=89.85 TRINITY_DN1006_c0_g1_i1:3-1211(+)